MALKVDELLKYNGISPCPSDIDIFWDEQVKLVEELDDNLVMKKSEFTSSGVEMFDCWFTGIEGAKVYFKYLRPLGTKNNRVIVGFHGYTANSGEWSSYLRYVYNGFAVAVMDCRGQGGRSQDVGGVKGNTHFGHIYRGVSEWNPSKLYYRNVYLDTVQMTKIVCNMEENSKDDVTSIGDSQGGALALACASLSKYITKTTPVYPFLSDYKYNYENYEKSVAFAELADYFRLQDPTHKTEDKFFELLGYIDIQNLVHRVTAKVLFASGLKDNVVAPKSQFAAYNKIASEKELVTFPDYGHDYLLGNADLIFDFIVNNK